MLNNLECSLVVEETEFLRDRAEHPEKQPGLGTNFLSSFLSLFFLTDSKTKVPVIPVIVLQQITRETERM